MTAVFWSTPEPMWLYLTQHDGFLWNAIWGLKGQVHSTELSCLALHVLWFIWIPWIVSQYCVVLGKRPKFFCLVFYLVKDQISLPFFYSKTWFFYSFDTSLMKCALSDESWSSFACEDWGAPLYPNMIPWPITNSLVYCELFQNNIKWIFYNLLTFI